MNSIVNKPEGSVQVPTTLAKDAEASKVNETEVAEKPASKATRTLELGEAEVTKLREALRQPPYTWNFHTHEEGILARHDSGVEFIGTVADFNELRSKA